MAGSKSVPDISAHFELESMLTLVFTKSFLLFSNPDSGYDESIPTSLTGFSADHVFFIQPLGISAAFNPHSRNSVHLRPATKNTAGRWPPGLLDVVCTELALVG